MHELDAPGAPEFEAIALASLSDAGRVRSENQDVLALLENTSRERLLLVADGMGGHRGGETASRICLQMVERVFREPHGTPEQRLRRSLELANEEIYSHALANPELRGMGTTAVAALLAPLGGAWVAWVGDSRCYRLRDGALEQLTQDHTLMTEWIAIGVITAEAAKAHPRRHELTRALGQSPDVAVDLVAIDLRPGDRLLLCSDGLHGYVAESVLALALATGTPDEVARALVDAANASGGTDNVSVVVAALPDAPAPAPVLTECAPEIAAELEALGEFATLAEPEPIAEPEPQPEASFADLDAEVSEPEAEPSPEQEPEFLPPAAQQIQIPLMTPVRVRRGLDVTSLVVGVGATLLVVGLGIGMWSYTTARSVPVVRAAPPPVPPSSHATKPAPEPQRAAPAVVKPIEKPPAKPEIAKPAIPPEPRVEKPPVAPAAQAAIPAAQPRALPRRRVFPPRPVVARGVAGRQLRAHTRSRILPDRLAGRARDGRPSASRSARFPTSPPHSPARRAVATADSSPPRSTRSGRRQDASICG
jgi:protein phosphatase